MPDYYNLPIWRSDPRHKEVYEVECDGFSEAAEAEERDPVSCTRCDLNAVITGLMMKPMASESKHIRAGLK